MKKKIYISDEKEIHKFSDSGSVLVIGNSKWRTINTTSYTSAIEIVELASSSNGTSTIAWGLQDNINQTVTIYYTVTYPTDMRGIYRQLKKEIRKIHQNFYSIFNTKPVNPMRVGHTLEIWEVKDHRKFDCYMYEKCLNHAVSHNWESFTCSRCSAYKKCSHQGDTGGIKRLLKALTKSGRSTTPSLTEDEI